MSRKRHNQEKPPIKLRDADQIQHAHDVFVACLASDPPVLDLSERDKWLMGLNANILCWVLEHDHNDNFARNFAALQAELISHGVEEIKHNVPVTQAKHDEIMKEHTDE